MTHKITVQIDAEGFDSADDAVLAVCAAMDWWNDMGGPGELEYVNDYEGF